MCALTSAKVCAFKQHLPVIRDNFDRVMPAFIPLDCMHIFIKQRNVSTYFQQQYYRLKTVHVFTNRAWKIMPCISRKWMYVKSSVYTTIRDFGEKLEKLLQASQDLQPSVHLFPIQSVDQLSNQVPFISQN